MIKHPLQLQSLTAQTWFDHFAGVSRMLKRWKNSARTFWGSTVTVAKSPDDACSNR